MRLDDLYSRTNRLRLLYENDTGQPLEATRYPSIRKHTLAKYEPSIDVEDEVDALKNMVYEYPKSIDPPDLDEAIKALRRSQAAFRRLINRMQLNPMSGLRGEFSFTKACERATAAVAKKEKFNRPGPSEYIVVAADVDDMKFLNEKTGLGHTGVNAILQNIGQLFKENFNIEDTKAYHPCGDEFGVISRVGGDQETARLRFAKLLRACVKVSNELAETGFHLEGWDEARRVQPTISFGISTTNEAAEGLLAHVKTGASSGKSMKFVIVVDRDLRYDLGFSPEEMNEYVQKVQPETESQVVTMDPPDVAVYESKLPMDDVRGKKGPVVVECSWSENPRKQELSGMIRQSQAYRDVPGGVQKVGKNYYPLSGPVSLSR